MRKAMAGTLRGAQRCAACGHGRIRHLDGPPSRCADLAWRPATNWPGHDELHAYPCDCLGFTTERTLTP